LAALIQITASLKIGQRYAPFTNQIREPWTLILSRDQEGIFLNHPVNSTSPPTARRFPPPPSAAPAAGGGGNLGPRRVHSVGVARVFADGVREMVARLVLLFVLQVVLFLSGGGAHWSVAAERPLPRARGPRGRRVRSIPFRISSRRIRSTLLKQLEDHQGDAGDGARRRLSGVRGPMTSCPLGDLLPSKASVEKERRRAFGTSDVLLPPRRVAMEGIECMVGAVLPVRNPYYCDAIARSHDL
jgi:hypothetical protein